MKEPVKFAGTISKMGERQRVIVIPKALHKDLARFEGKQVIVTISEL